MTDFKATTIQSDIEAVLAAVTYADVFDYCLSDQEVTALAVGRKIEGAVLERIEDDRLVHQDGYWCLSGRQGLLGLKKAHSEIKAAKLRILQRWLWLFALIPGVLMVGVTGSVAGGNPRSEDDIDLLVICRSDRMWLSRLLLTSWLSLLGKRRKPEHQDNEVKDLLCLNMWLNTKSLVEQADIYVANELARIVPVLNRQQTYERYLEANRWTDSYLPNFRQPVEINPWEPGRWSLWVLVGDGAEWLSKKLLMMIMRQPSVELVADDRLQFHPSDYHQQIVAKYRQKLLEVGIVG